MSRRETSTGPCRQRSRRRRLRERRPASPGRRRCGTVRRRLLRCLIVHRPRGQQTGAGIMNMDTSPSLTSGRLLSSRGRPTSPEAPHAECSPFKKGGCRAIRGGEHDPAVDIFLPPPRKTGVTVARRCSSTFSPDTGYSSSPTALRARRRSRKSSNLLALPSRKVVTPANGTSVSTPPPRPRT